MSNLRIMIRALHAVARNFSDKKSESKVLGGLSDLHISFVRLFIRLYIRPLHFEGVGEFFFLKFLINGTFLLALVRPSHKQRS